MTEPVTEEFSESSAGLYTVAGLRILCIAELRGALSQINALAGKYRANVVVHTGNFGFFDLESSSRLSPSSLQTLAHLSPFFQGERLPHTTEALRAASEGRLSELPSFLGGTLSLSIPVYTTYGSQEDVVVLEKFRTGEYSVPNLHILDEQSTYTLGPAAPGGAVVRLYGLGGAFMEDRLLYRGDSEGSIAGTSGLVWTSLWQIGDLIKTVRTSYNEREVRFFVTHEYPATQVLLEYLALMLRMDYTISSGVHKLYATSAAAHTDNGGASVPVAGLDDRVDKARAKFIKLWSTYESGVAAITPPADNPDANAGLESIRELIYLAVELYKAPIKLTSLKNTFSHLWNFNLCDAAVGVTVLTLNGSNVSAEMVSKGFDFSSRQSSSNRESLHQPRWSRETRDVRLESKEGSTWTKRAPSEDSEGAGRLGERRPSTSSLQSVDRAKSTPKQSALWFRDGSRSKEEILDCLAEEDKANVKQVVFRGGAPKPDGTQSKSVLVYFDTEEHTQSAYDRLDKNKAGTVSIQTPSSQRHHGGGRPRRGGFQKK